MRTLTVTALAVLLAACGGGGAGTIPQTTDVSGAGPASGAGPLDPAAGNPQPAPGPLDASRTGDAAVGQSGEAGPSSGTGGGSSSGGGSAFQRSAQGAWISCDPAPVGTADQGHALTISGAAYTMRTYRFTTGTRTCGGTGTLVSTESGTLVFGGAVPATLDGAPVTAAEVDVRPSTGTPTYTIGYADPATGRLFLGDTSAELGLDGSSSDARPMALATASYGRGTFANIGGDGPVGASLQTSAQGAWIACDPTPAGTADTGYALTISGTTYTRSTYRFTTGTRTCGGTGAQVGATQAGTVAFGTASVAATLNGASVTATSMDLTPSGGSTSYGIGYFDATASRLYLGDPAATAGLDGATAARRPAVLDPAPFAHGTFPNVSGGTGATSLQASAQGAWIACDPTPAGTADVGYALTISGTAYTWSTYRFTTTTRTCGGTGSIVGAEQVGAVAFGTAVAATRNGTSVTATTMDFTPSGGATSYSVGYYDAASSRLYLGDLTATAGRDGTTAARRPTVLDTAPYAAGRFTNIGGSTGGVTVTYSCTAAPVCEQVSAPAITTAQVSQLSSYNACTFTAGTCPATGFVAGSCYFADASAVDGVAIPSSTARLYYQTSVGAAAAASSCASAGGVWQP